MSRNFTSTMIAVASLNGYLARDEKDDMQWTSEEDKKQLHQFLKNHTDISIIGRKTYDLAKHIFQEYPCLILTRDVETKEQVSDHSWKINPEKTSLIEFIEERRWQNISVLGGKEVYTYFLNKNLIDEIRLTIEPVLFDSGMLLFEGLKNAPNLSLISSEELGSSGAVLVRYKIT